MDGEVSVQRDIAASADAVWALITDLTRMGEWSSENRGGKWLGGASGPAVGARFRGNNKNGFHRWSTIVTVTEAEPGKRFTFDVSYFRLPISTWSYDFVDAGDGCTVTERWRDRRPGWFRPIAELGTGVGDRAEHTKNEMAKTLARLAAVAESAAD